MRDPLNELIEKVRNGDTGALADYLQQVRPQLMAFIERQLGTPLRRKVDPEDIFQEISVEIDELTFSRTTGLNEITKRSSVR